MVWNRYVRNGEVRFSSGSQFSFVELYGTAKYAPSTPYMAPSECGRPGEMIFHIAGVMYYPTPAGYVKVNH